MTGKILSCAALLASGGTWSAMSSPPEAWAAETVLHLPPTPGNPRNSEGGFVELRDDRILFVYSRYQGESWQDHASAELVGRYSNDGGRTWGDRDRLLISNDALNVMSVSLLRLADGRIALLYLRKSRNPNGEIDCRPLICFSEDEGEHWSEPRDIIPVPGYYVVNNDRLIQLTDGRLLLPVGFHRYRPGSEAHIDSRSIMLFYYSDDGGATWHEAPEWVLPPAKLSSGFQEPGVVELRDGRLMAWARTSDGAQYVTHSADRGMTWDSPRRATEFRSPEAPLSIKRDPLTAELVAIWNDHDPRWPVARQPASWGRTPLVLARSADDGQTWTQHQLLEDRPDHGYCYSAMLFTGDALLLGYCAGGGELAVLQQLELKRLVRVPAGASAR